MALRRQQNLDKQTLKMEPFAIIDKGPVYKVHRYLNTQKKLRLYGRIFHHQKIQKFAMTNTIEQYKKIFAKKVCEEVNEGKNINFILKNINEKNQPNMFGFGIKPYEESLQSYLMKNQIDEDEALDIMRQVIEAIYSVIQAGYKICNIRAENFVKVWKDSHYIMTEEYNIRKDQKTLNLQRQGYSWKLDSLPQFFYGPKQINHYRPFTSQFIWSKTHQAPQFYDENQIKPDIEDIQESLVWSIGSIFLDILAGTHLLGCIQNIRELHQKNYQIELFIDKKVNRKIRIAPDTKTLLKRMLQLSSKERMKLGQLFKVTRLCQGIKKFLQRKFSQSMEEKGSMQNRYRSQNFEGKNVIKSVGYFRNTVFQEVEGTLNTKFVPENRKSISMEDFFNLQDKIKQHKFINIQQLFEQLISILHHGDTIPITMEQFKMLDFLKKEKNIGVDKSINISRTNNHKRLKKKPSNANEYISEDNQSMTHSRILQKVDQSGQTVTQIFVSCLLPYKRQYQKTLFLSLISIRITYFQQQEIEKYEKSDKVSKQALQKMKDDRFLTRARFFKLRLIILHSLSQSLSLSYNIFNIGENEELQIHNIYYTPNVSQKWILFVTSGMYNSLKIFIQKKHQQCLNEFTQFLENSKNYTSPYTQKQFTRITKLNYKVCPLPAFMPIFKEIKLIMQEWNKKYHQTENKGYLRYLGYLSYAICCDRAHEKSDEETNFKDYAGYPYFYSKSSLKRIGQTLKMQDSFNFSEYDKFILEGNIKEVNQHMNELSDKYFGKKK